MDASPPTDQLNQPFAIIFPDGSSARAVRVCPTEPIPHILNWLQLTGPRPMLFVSGGATDMAAWDMAATREIIEGVARFAQRTGVGIVDGGTSSGVMGILGTVRRQRGYTFPLIGIAPRGLIAYPGYTNHAEVSQLDSGHSHFVLVEANRWDSVSESFIQLPYALADGRQRLGLVINGGMFTKNEAYLATCKYRMPVVALAGSGRFADELAAAITTRRADNPITAQIIESGQVQLASMHSGAQAIVAQLAAYFYQKL